MLQRLAVLAVVCALWGATPGRGHGRLLEPPSHASAWRFGFPTPHNYNDHEVYCGGVTRQWRKNGGNCGVCGDAWDQKTPRPHELGGRFGQGLIVRRYAPGATFSVRVDLTVDHGGFWELRLCPSVENTTQECLDRYLLHTEDGAERFFPKDGNKVYETNYTLPTGLTCERCVIQWRYIAANSWGSCPNGTGAIGCGHQEEFRACADVAILPPPRTRPSYVAPTRRVTTTTTEHTTTEVTFSEPDNDIAEDIKDSTQDDLSQAAPAGALAAGVTLCVVLACFSLVYLVYYRGDRIKKLLKMSGRAPPEPAEATAAPPERPPRHKKPQDSHRLESDNSSEPGFENIRLHENMI